MRIDADSFESALRIWLLSSLSHRLSHRQEPLTVPITDLRLVEFRADWAAHADLWKVRHYRHGPLFCHICGASRQPGPHDFRDFGVSPGWQGTEVLNSVFCAGKGRRECALSTLPGFHVAHLKICYLHTAHLGYGRLVSGAILFELCKEGHFVGGGANLETELRAAHAQLKDWCWELVSSDSPS